jgi:hypothetical protein
VWQQQDRQHSSAVAHPQRHASQGYRSGERLATETNGNGTPTAVQK